MIPSTASTSCCLRRLNYSRKKQNPQLNLPATAKHSASCQYVNNRALTKQKWVVDLKHYDPSTHYSYATICCPSIDLDEYPQFKFLQRNELLIVRGTVRS